MGNQGQGANTNTEYIAFGRQVGYGFIAKIIITFLGLIRFPILAKGLGVYLYGVFALIYTTISFILPFAMLTFNLSIVRFLAAEKDVRKIREDYFSACSIVFISGLLFSIGLLAFSDLLAINIFKDPQMSFYLKLAAFLILFDSLYNVTTAFFRMRRRIGLYTFFTLCYYTLQVGLITVAIFLGYKLTGVIIALIINAMVISLAAVMVVIRMIGARIPKFVNMKSYLKWGIPLAPNSAVMWIIQSSDKYLIAYFLGITQAGIYSAAYALGEYTFFLMVPIITVLYPIISKYYDEGNIHYTKKCLKYALKYSMMFLIPSAFGLSVLAKTLLNVLTTPEFIPGLFVVPIVAFGAVMFCFFQISIFIVHLVHKTAITIKLLIVSALLNVILNIILVPLVGIVGAAIATLIAYSVLGILTIIVTQKDIKYDLSLPFLVISTFSAAVMALIIWLINPTNIIMILITILIGIIIYFCMLLLLRAFTEEEMKHMNKYKNAISRRINAFFLGSCMRVTVFRNAKYKGHIFKTKKEL